MAKLSPENGGCWYCQTDGQDNWLMSSEFDCNLHQSCLEFEINNRKTQEDYYGELEIFMTEFEYYIHPHEHYAIREDDNLKLVESGHERKHICLHCRILM